MTAYPGNKVGVRPLLPLFTMMSRHPRISLPRCHQPHDFPRLCLRQHMHLTSYRISLPHCHQPHHFSPAMSPSAQVPSELLYSPSHPEMAGSPPMSQWDIIYVGPDKSMVVVRDHSLAFKIDINSSCAEAHIDRLKQMINNPEHLSASGDKIVVRGTDFISIVEEVANMCGLSELYLDHVHQFINAPQKVRPVIAGPSVTSPEHSLATRARALLKRGAMPLLPPSPRVWSEDEEATFQGPSSVFKWPPRGWQLMTPSRKRQLFEFVAMSLDIGSSGLPTAEPEELCDQYNFLLLPGSAKMHRTDRQRMRVYNFIELRKIAVTGKGDLRFLLMMERAADLRTRPLISIWQ